MCKVQKGKLENKPGIVFKTGDLSAVSLKKENKPQMLYLPLRPLSILLLYVTYTTTYVGK